MNHVYRLPQGKMGRKKAEPLKKGHNDRTGLGEGGTRVKDAENKSALNKKRHFILGE